MVIVWGGYIAYALAKKLRELGHAPPSFLVVSAVTAPCKWTTRQKLSALSREEFTKFFNELGGFNSELLKHETFMQEQMELVRHDIQICESAPYEQPASFSFPIYAIAGGDDPYVKKEHMMDWQHETVVDFSLECWPGAHFYLNQSIDRMVSFISERMLMAEDSH